METATRSVTRSKRSRAGCSNCRRQRIKCDEQYPTCQECVKRNRTCNLAESRFRTYDPVDSGTGRSASRNGTQDVTSPTFRSRLLDFETPSRPVRSGQDSSHSVTQESSSPASSSAPRMVTDSQVQASPVNGTGNFSGGFEVNTTPDGGNQATTPGARLRVDESLPNPSLTVSLSPVPRQADDPPGITNYQEQRITYGNSFGEVPIQSLIHHDQYYSLDEQTTARDRVTLTPSTQLSPCTQPEIPIRLGLETSEERAFFLRKFSSRTAKWMDLFDLDCFYSREVPVLALNSPVIMFSACAFAARQLSLTSRRPPTPGSSSNHPHQLTQTHSRERDYTWFAEAYYDAAISLLRRHTSDIATQNSSSVSQSGVRFENSPPPMNKAGFPGLRLHDEIVVAVTILSCYEFLAGVAPNWSDHLDGTRSFLRLLDEAGFLDFGPSSPFPSPSAGPSRLHRATFWNFARQDMLSAFTQGQKTRLEIDDLALWRRMGLNLGVDGRLAVGTPSSQVDHSLERIDLVSNTTVYMLAKLINFITTYNSDVEPLRDQTTISSEAYTYLNGWLSLKDEFQVWYDNLPPLFQPVSRVTLPRHTSPRCTDCSCHSRALIDHETWHSDSMCCSTMQSYHMARILLLLHKPPTVPISQLPWPEDNPQQQPARRFPDTLSDMNRMNEMLQYHAVEICAIALSRPEEAARVHMLQPLYMAGRCLTDGADRRTVVKLIDGIEDELGWHSKYRVEVLLEEWGVSRDGLGSCHAVSQG